MSRRPVALAPLLLLAGCTSWFAAEDTSEPPTELAPIDAQLRIEQVWSTDVGAGSDERGLSLVPALGKGRVFAASPDGQLHAVELASGRRLWRVDTKAAISGGPGVGEGLVLVGTIDGRVLAFRAADGEPAWEAKVSSEVLSVPRAGRGVAAVRTIDGRLAGLDASTGERRWVYDRSTPTLSLRGTSSPVFAAGVVASGFDDGQLVALSAEDGRVLWERRVAVPHGRSELERMVDVDADPVVWGDAVFVASYQGRIGALGLDTGRVQWSRELSVHKAMAFNGRALYATDDSGQVWGLDPASGGSLWKQDKLKWRSVTGPAAVGDHVVVGDFEGYLHWLSARDGTLVGRVRAASKGISAAPVAAEDMVIALSENGELAAFRAGEPR